MDEGEGAFVWKCIQQISLEYELGSPMPHSELIFITLSAYKIIDSIKFLNRLKEVCKLGTDKYIDRILSRWH